MNLEEAEEKIALYRGALPAECWEAIETVLHEMESLADENDNLRDEVRNLEDVDEIDDVDSFVAEAIEDFAEEQRVAPYEDRWLDALFGALELEGVDVSALVARVPSCSRERRELVSALGHALDLAGFQIVKVTR